VIIVIILLKNVAPLKGEAVLFRDAPPPPRTTPNTHPLASGPSSGAEMRPPPQDSSKKFVNPPPALTKTTNLRADSHQDIKEYVKTMGNRIPVMEAVG